MRHVPRIGVGVLVVRDGLVLLGQRRGAHGAGSWALPGGHLDPGETIEGCALRELEEETGLRADAATHCHTTHDVLEGIPYLTHFVVVSETVGEPAVREPHKCAGWRWSSWDLLPSPLFGPLASLRASGYRPPIARMGGRDRLPGVPPSTARSHPMSDQAPLVTVLATGDSMQVIVAKLLLESADIRFVVQGEGVQDLFGIGRVTGGPNFITGPIQIRVLAEDAEAAREVLRELDEAAEADADGDADTEDPA